LKISASENHLATLSGICSVDWSEEEAQMRRLVRNWNGRLLFNGKSGQEIAGHARVHQDAKSKPSTKEEGAGEVDQCQALHDPVPKTLGRMSRRQEVGHAKQHHKMARKSRFISPQWRL